MHRAEAFMAIHDPVDRKNFDNALQTLRYEEALICQTALVKSRAMHRVYSRLPHALKRG